MLEAVIEQMISEAEAKMPTVSPELASDTHAKHGGWSGFVVGAGSGAYVGAGLGIAGGPLGAIAGTIPGAVVGGIIGYFSGEKVGANFEVEEQDQVDSATTTARGICTMCGRHIVT